MSQKISACLVVYNEEKNIRRCLESLVGAVDEIIVAHDGPCSDQTLAIVKEYTTKVFIREHAGSMEEHLPFVFKQAIGGWILRIDADEFLSPELKNNLRCLAEDKTIYAYEFLWPRWDGEKQITHSWPYKLVFFRRDKVSFLGVPHFIPVVNGRVVKSNLVLEHHPAYDNFSWPVFKTKWLSWAKIQAECYLKDFKEIEKFNYQENDWSCLIKFRVKHPLLLFLPDAGITFLKNIFTGSLKDWLITLKNSFYWSLYRGAVDYFIYLKIKHRGVK